MALISNTGIAIREPRVPRGPIWGCPNFWINAQDFSHLVRIRRKRISQPERIGPLQRIRYVLVKIESASQSYRVVAGEPPAARIIVAVAVIREPRFFIMLLSLESYQGLRSAYKPPTIRDPSHPSWAEGLACL